jgi:RNA polymerase sigma-70 factor (ECF subfamily)
MQISQDLLSGCKKGDRKAQYQLFRLCFDTLMGVCLRYQKEESEAMASLNLGFFKILNNLDKYRPEMPFEAWIRRIMINTLIDEFRKNRQVKELMEYRDFSDEQNTRDWADYNDADQMLSAGRLTAMLQTLPAMSRKVFNLYAIDGYSHKEIAAMLEISEGTSKWHVNYARKRLQEMVKEALSESRVV